jgi:RHS repeat-associated protein
MGGGIGSILYSDRGATREHFTYNAVGHTVALTLQSGSVSKSDLYEAYGNIVASTGSSSNNRLANTKERSFTLGLDNHGFRYYDPEIGRYITRDPIGYGDGLNVYLYVRNNPINHIDPLGLKTIPDYEAELRKAREDYSRAIADAKRRGIQGRGLASAGIKEMQKIIQLEGKIEGIKKAAESFNEYVALLVLANQIAGNKVDETGWFVDSNTLDDETEFGSQLLTYQKIGAFNDAAGIVYSFMGGGGLVKGGFKKLEAQAKAAFQKGFKEGVTHASVDRKLIGYILNPNHPKGSSKAKWFKEALGFTESNADDLSRQLTFDPSTAVQTAATEHGTKFNQIINVVGANGRTVPVKVGWIRNNDGFVRMTTAVPGN